MKKTVRITESDITRLTKKIVNEQERIDDPSDKYFMEIDYVANYAMDEAMEPEDIEAAIDEISDIMGEADSDEDLSDYELDDIISYGGQVIMELENMFDSEESMNEQTKPSDFSKFPCLSNFKETSTPKGDRVKMGSGFWKNYQFYSNGRVLNIRDNSKAFFKCYDGDGIIISQDPNDEPDI